MTGQATQYDESKDNDGRGVCFEALLGVNNEGGDLFMEAGKLKIRNADAVSLLIAAWDHPCFERKRAL